MEQLVLLLVIAAISFINWIIQKSAEHRKKKKLEQAQQNPDVYAEPSEHFEEAPAQGSWQPPEDELKKFLEAMGLPVEEPPPIPTPPPASAPQASASVQAQPTPPPQVAKPRRTTTTREMRELASSFENADAYGISTPAPTSSLAFLSSVEKIREAVVLREILGPPRAIQPYGESPDDLTSR